MEKLASFHHFHIGEPPHGPLEGGLPSPFARAVQRECADDEYDELKESLCTLPRPSVGLITLPCQSNLPSSCRALNKLTHSSSCALNALTFMSALIPAARLSTVCRSGIVCFGGHASFRLAEMAFIFQFKISFLSIRALVNSVVRVEVRQNIF